MKTLPLLAILIVAPATLLTAPDPAPLQSSYQRGLMEEEVNRDLDAAIDAYRSAIDAYDRDRPTAAAALFRLAECQLQTGRTNDAILHYQRLLQEFANQPEVATLARQQLQTLKIELRPDTDDRAISSLEQQRALLEQEITVVERQRKATNIRFERGVASQDEVFKVERELLSLQRELAALELPSVGSPLASIQQPATAAGIAGMGNDEVAAELRRVQEIVRNSPDLIHALGENGRQPLHDAAEKGQLSVAAFYLQRGAAVNATDRWGNTPLHLAATAGHRAMAETLLREGADVNAATTRGITPLHEAAKRGFVALATLLLDNGAKVSAGGWKYSSTSDQSGVTPLHQAVEGQFDGMVELLLARDANVNATAQPANSFSWRNEPMIGTPLHFAVRRGNARIVKLLLHHQADVNAVTLGNRTPLITAVLHHPDLVPQLLEHQPALDQPAEGGLTALHLAVADFQIETVEHLLAAGANPDQPLPGSPVDSETRAVDFWFWAAQPPYSRRIQCYGQTALHLAVGPDYREDPGPDNSPRGPGLFVHAQGETILSLLLKHGASVNATNQFNRTALHDCVSAINGVALAKLLLDAGATVDPADHQGFTPLLRAVQFRRSDVAALLLERGANPQAKTASGAGAEDLLAAGRAVGHRPPGLPIPDRRLGAPATPSEAESALLDLLRQSEPASDK